MSRSIHLREGQKYIYKVEVIRVFKAQSYEERQAKAPRVRLDEAVIEEIRWYDNPTSARNYGSYRTNRSQWYNNIGKPTHEYVYQHPGTGKVLSWEEFYRMPYTERLSSGYEYTKRALPQPVEPDRDYRVYRVPVTLDMGEATLLPALKRLYEIVE